MYNFKTVLAITPYNAGTQCHCGFCGFYCRDAIVTWGPALLAANIHAAPVQSHPDGAVTMDPRTAIGLGVCRIGGSSVASFARPVLIWHNFPDEGWCGIAY